MEKSFDELPVAIDCHPTNDLITVGFIDGTISLSSFLFQEITQSRKNIFDQGNQSIEVIKLRLTELRLHHHKRSVRRLKFSPDSGDRIVVITKNRALCLWDVVTGKKLRCIREAHDSPPFALHCSTDHVTMTGDEIGEIKVWDWRLGTRPPCVATFSDAHVDIVNDLTSSADHRTLLAVSGDATLSAFNLRKRALEMQSEEMHAELLSVAIARNGSKVLCGSGEGGYVEIFNWNEFGNISERMQSGHRDSVDRLLNVDESGLVVSASADGSIRLLRFGPNTDLGCIGQHVDPEGKIASSVEDLTMTQDRKYLISCGQDQKIRFWDIEQYLHGKEENGEDSPLAKKVKKTKKRIKAVDAAFFQGLTDESGNNGTPRTGQDSDDGDTDDSDSD